jgi:tripartite-type tricarboxylate transporter receptor subunit TctC
MTFTNGHALTMALGKSNLKLEDMRPSAGGSNDPQILMVNCKTSPCKNADQFLAGWTTSRPISSRNGLRLCSLPSHRLKAARLGAPLA